ncbi:MAG: tripartite tricarboxylate transporter substrate binding protein [Burkholderiales bacterium]|nr:tripartite tricarboxylate transporter substrate binding protein [Burkholderiales bacterium]
MSLRWLPALFGLAMFAVSASAEDKYPSRPVTFIVPQATGGANDAIARVIAQKLSVVMNRQFLVDNRPGAGGNIATALVAKARPDGYTLLLTANSMLVINPALYRSPGFDPVKDFEPVSLVATAGFVIAANPAFPPNSIKELIAAAKASPEPLLYGSAGVGTINHLLGEMFNKAAGIRLAHVPYKAATTAVADVMSGQIPLAVLSVPVSLGMVQAGKLKVLGVANERRIAALPDAPTIGETVKGFGATPWYGVVAPAGTPKAIVDQLHAMLQQVLDAKDVQEKLVALGCEVRKGGPAQFSALIRDDLPKWAKVVAESGATVE